MFPPLSANKGTEGPLVIEAKIRGHAIHRMYVDGGSSMEVLYEHCFNRLRPEIKSQMVPATTSLTGFSGETIWPLGQLRLLVTIGDAEHFTKAWMNFMIVRSPSPYNGIIGRPGIREIQAVPSTAHGMLKFPVNDQEVALGGMLSIEGRMALCALPKRNLDIFAWQSSDMTGVPRQISPGLTEKEEPGSRTSQGHPGIGTEASISRDYARSLLPWLGYHQIQMAELDEEKTAFHTPHGVYCYTKMSFGLKNTGATYQQLVDMAFEKQVGRNLEVYVDDLVIKSHTEANLLRDIEETFRTHKTVPIEDRSCVCNFNIPTDNQGGSGALMEVYAGLNRSGVGFQTTETTYIRTPHVGGTKAKGRANKTLFTDGSSCIDGLGAGLILTSPDGAEFTYALRFQFTASNNEAEYEALLAGLRITAQMGVRNVQVSVDSKLVANQVLGTYIAKEENMIKYLEKVLVEVLQEKSIQEKEVAAVVEEEGPTWMTPITEYLKDGVLPDDKKEANKLRIKARQYELMDGILYRRSFLRPWLRCVGPLQADYVIREIHEGSCSMHAGPRSVVAKAMRSGYYWPTMHRDARDMILKCKDCQVHRPVPRNPQQPLTPITSPWPFYKWGIDIAGPFPEGPGKVKFLIVAMDYFTKWIEAKAVATISGGQVKKFVWDNIVCRFGLPGEIVSENGKQSNDNPFKDWCEKLNITQRFASIKHPQSNGLVERANRSLGEGIKAHLGEGNKNWIEEIPHVLWAHCTMIKSSNGDTPFSLTYGTEAVIPAEIGMPTYRTAVVDIVRNDDEIRLNLDLLEERRERAAIREAKANNEESHAMDGGKLGPKWEGPYEVTEVLGGGAYNLRSMDGAVLPQTWNIANLKKCYL
ncbi:reverse transcriptase domain-containing protein [Tanacetum coccineum]